MSVFVCERSYIKTATDGVIYCASFNFLNYLSIKSLPSVMKHTTGTGKQKT